MRQANARGEQEKVLQKQREERQMEKDVQDFFERKKMEATAQKQFLASATKQQVEEYFFRSNCIFLRGTRPS